MSLRMVAGDTPRLCRSTSALEPTGSSVDTKSWTMARRTASFRSSSTAAHLLLALGAMECQCTTAGARPPGSPDHFEATARLGWAHECRSITRLGVRCFAVRVAADHAGRADLGAVRAPVRADRGVLLPRLRRAAHRPAGAGFEVAVRAAAQRGGAELPADVA